MYFSSALSPRDVCGISLAIDIDVLSIDDQLASFSVDIALESSVCRVILEHVDPIPPKSGLQRKISLDHTCTQDR